MSTSANVTGAEGTMTNDNHYVTNIGNQHPAEQPAERRKRLAEPDDMNTEGDRTRPKLSHHIDLRDAVTDSRNAALIVTKPVRRAESKQTPRTKRRRISFKRPEAERSVDSSLGTSYFEPNMASPFKSLNMPAGSSDDPRHETVEQTSVTSLSDQTCKFVSILRDPTQPRRGDLSHSENPTAYISDDMIDDLVNDPIIPEHVNRQDGEPAGAQAAALAARKRPPDRIRLNAAKCPKLAARFPRLCEQHTTG